MGTRIRDKKLVKKIFECYMVIEPPWNEGEDSLLSNGKVPEVDGNGRTSPADALPRIKSIFPSTYNARDVLKSAAQFAFPCPTTTGTVELFTFVLTNQDSKWTYGYCRHQYGSQSGVVFLTFLPWQEIFYRLLNYCTEIDETRLVAFLDRLYTIPVPEAGTCLYVPTNSKPFICPIPSDLALPSIPENRNVSEFYNALSPESMLVLFAALLSERRIVITSKKLSRLSSLTMACNLFLFPLCWQHIFIPVLPMQLSDYLSAPMPFMIGVPINVWDRLPPDSLGQIVRVDADTNTVTTPFPEDLESLPQDVVTLLRKNLMPERVLGDGLARAFLRALAQIMGHYQEAIRDEGQSFDDELFIQFAHPSHRAFITNKLQNLQIFRQFIDDRLQKIRKGECESDEFELEALAWKASRSNGKNGMQVLRSISSSQNRTAIKKAGKAVMMTMKRESGNILDSVKQNSALKSAFRSVKESSRSVKQKSHIAVTDIKSKFHVPSTSRHTTGNFSDGNSQEAYRRHGQVSRPSKNLGNLVNVLSPDTPTSKDDNLFHFGSFSASSSTMNDLNEQAESSNPRVQVTPRLSRSEENLIDLDGPTGLGYTLANPLYDLASNNSVFEDSIATTKSDAQLISEYGLSDYFNNLHLSTGNISDGFQGSQGRTDMFLDFEASNNSSTGSSQQRLSTNSGTASKWATFE